MACRLQSDLSTLIGNLQVINSWGGLYLHCESMWEHSFFIFLNILCLWMSWANRILGYLTTIISN